MKRCLITPGTQEEAHGLPQGTTLESIRIGYKGQNLKARDLLWFLQEGMGEAK